MAATVERALHLGFRFEPTPRDAVSYYLPRLISGEPMHAAIRPYIHAADVYACAPGALAARHRPTPGKGDRFFFTVVARQRARTGRDVRYVRVAGPGSWAFQRSEDVRDGAGGKVGEVRKLRYRCRDGGAFTDWLMEEYACGAKGAMVGDKERVFCRIYVSPNAGAESAARRESAAFFAAPPEPEPVVVTAPAVARKVRPPPVLVNPPEPVVVIAPAMARKVRPPPLAVNPPCPKRIRGAPISPVRPPPLMQPGQSPAIAPSLQPPSQQPKSSVPAKVPVSMQPGRSPAAPAIPRRSQQPKSYVAWPRAHHHMIPEPPASVPAPPVKQEPLTPPPASPDPLLPAVEDDSAEADDDGNFDDLISRIESSLPTTEDPVDGSEDAEADDQVASSSSDGTADVNEQGQQVPPPQEEADDDFDQFANSLGDILLVQEEEEEEEHQVPPLQKEARKCLDPFEAVFADEE